MTEANPSTRFFCNDWENDIALKLCSLAAQGLWMRMLCVMARSDPVGYLVIEAAPCNTGDLAKLVGEDEEKVTELVNELERREIFSRNRVDTIYNRRMTREAKQSATNRENGSKGGRVSREKGKGIFGSLGKRKERSAERRKERDTRATVERQDERPPEPSYSSRA